jgi:hypothetical protein
MSIFPKGFIGLGSLRRCQICDKFKSLTAYKSIDYEKTKTKDLWSDDKSNIKYTIKPFWDLCNDCETDIKDSISEQETERVANDTAVFNEACLYFSTDDMEALKEYVDESSSFDFIISDEPCTKEVENNDEYPFEVYVNQTCNGGLTGDDYSGYASVKLAESKYLTFCYVF